MSGSHIFISYAHTDEQYVRRLARGLADAGLVPWYFSESQTGGVNWAQRLLDTVSQARAVIVLISEASNSPKAEYVLAEVMLAQRERRFIIPLKIAQCSGPLDILLAARNWINAWDGSDPLPKVLEAITRQTGLAIPSLFDEFAQLIVHPAFQEHVGQRTANLILPGAEAFLEQGAPITLCRLGRDPRCDLAFAGTLKFVSRQHARIYAQSEPAGITFLLVDEQSSHGTFVNGQRVNQPHPLTDGDQIGLGTPRAMLMFTRLEKTGAPSEVWGEGSP